MGTASLRSEAWNAAWHGAWRGLLRTALSRSPSPTCVHLGRLWRRLRGKSQGTLLEGSRYCREKCLEPALDNTLRRISSPSLRLRGSHRVPLGLVLLSRQQLTSEQLRRALESQRAAGHGKIGEWLQALGFVNQPQVTAALARQWSCPVLGSNVSPPGPDIPQIPLTLLHLSSMVPISFVRSTSMLHIAFADGIDHSVLYAIEQMTGCRTEPCMAVPDLVRQRLQELAGKHAETEVVFRQLAGNAEFSRIIRSYSIHIAATEIRVAACGSLLWARLLRRSLPPLDLMLQDNKDATTGLAGDFHRFGMNGSF